MEPVKPDYGGACLSNLVPALLGERDGSWLPPTVKGARQVVLLVLDGLGWAAVREHVADMPVLSSFTGGPMETVVPSTTTVALTSLTTGLPPAEHGVVGYRMQVPEGVLNVLRWTVPQRGQPPAPATVQPHPVFCGRRVPTVTSAGYAGSGFSEIHLRGTRLCPAYSVSDLAEWVRVLAAGGEPFVYVYYGGLDLVAHMHGLPTSFFTAELRFADRLVAETLEALPGEAALVVTSDHGHVQYGAWIEPGEVAPLVAAYTGEARFRSLHARPGKAAELWQACRERVAD